MPVASSTAAVPVARSGDKRKWLAILALIAAISVIGGLAWWMGRGGEPDSTELAAAPAEVRRQMMVVLPFENLGGDSAQTSRME